MLRSMVLSSAAALALAGAGTQLASTAISGRAREPQGRLAAARRALDQARPGAAWAPEELAAAERLFLEAERRYRAEALRPYPWRSFEPVADALWTAELAARAALAAADERRESARADAQDALAEADDLLGHARLLAANTSLPARSRRQLGEARLAVEEARLRYEQGAFPEAGARAVQARGMLFAALGGILEIARRYTAAEQIETWQRWVEQTREWSRRSDRAALIVYKEKNRLVVLHRGEPVQDYTADIGASGLGRKLRRGDRATPEGRYRIVRKKGAGASQFYKALLLDYPNAEDRRRTAEARREGRVPADAEPGGLIEIHGQGGLGRNWTDGCVALSNADMDELFPRVEVGSWVTIVGGDGRDGILTRLLARVEPRGEPR